jgi:hypothetical protein
MSPFTFYIPRVGPECSGPFAAGLLGSHGVGRVTRVDIVPVGADDTRSSAEWAVVEPGQNYPRSYAFVHCEDVPAEAIARARSPRETCHVPLPVAPGSSESAYWILAESTADAKTPDRRAASHQLSTDGRAWTVVLRNSDAPEDDIRSTPAPPAAFVWPLLANGLRRETSAASGGLVLRNLSGFEASCRTAAAGLKAWLAADAPERPYRLSGKGNLGMPPHSSELAERGAAGLHRVVESIGAMTTCCPAAEWSVTPHPGGISLDINVSSPDVPRLQLAAQMVRDLCTVASLDGDLTLKLEPPCGLPTTYRCAKPRHVSLAQES